MAITKESKSFNMPWEAQYGFTQAVKVGDTINLSGQVGHDDKGNIVGVGDMEAQMRQTYANVKTLLAQYGATMDNIVDEIVFVTDVDAAFEARAKLKDEVFGGAPVMTSTLIGIDRLALPDLLVEVRCIARL